MDYFSVIQISYFSTAIALLFLSNKCHFMPGTDVAQNTNDAFKTVFDSYKKKLYGYVLSVTHSCYLAEEITQETFIKLWLRRDSLHEIENLDSYIFTIARNKILNCFRKAANDHKLLSELQRGTVTETNNVDEYTLAADYNKSVDDALQMLSGQRRLVYQLSRQHGLNHHEIATTLQLSPNTVKNHLVTALRTVRNCVKNSIVSTLILFTLSSF